MARGEQKQLFNADVAGANAAQTQANQLLSSAQAQQAPIVSQYTDISNNPMTDAEKNAQRGSLASTYQSLQNKAGETAARTRNTANLSSVQDDIARQQGTKASELEGSLDSQAFARKMAALSGLTGINNQNLNLANSALGRPVQYLNAANSPASSPGFWDTLGGAFAGTLGKGFGGALTPSFNGTAGGLQWGNG